MFSPPSVATAALGGFCQDSGSYPSQVLIPVYRQLGRAAAASIATSRALGGRGEVEWRARACNLSAPGSVAREGFATSSLLGITLDSDAVCGRLKICVDRWYNHLHVFTLILLALPLDHSLPILRPA